MPFQYIPYIWLLIASAVITLSLALNALIRRRKAKGAVSFILNMLLLTIWSLANALEMASLTFATKLFWANIQYFAYGFSPLTLLALCMEFTGYDKWIQNRKVLWLAVIPTIVAILVWTDGLYGLVRYDLQLDYSGLFPVIAKKYGPVFYIHAVYAHLLNFTGWVLLLRAVFLRNTVYRRQAIILLFSLSLSILPNILYILGISPVKRFDLTPVFFGPVGLITAWGIFRFKLFDLVPLARATVIEIMDAGVLVLDLQDRILDINPAFVNIIALPNTQIATKGIAEVCAKIPELVEACLDRSVTQTEFSLRAKEGLRVYELLLSPLTDSKGVLIGRLAITYDITEKKLAQQVFLKQQWRLAVSEERERLARDMHDNLGQVLGFINLQAQGIKQELTQAGVETAMSKLDQLVSVTQEAHQEVRDYIRKTREPAGLEKDFITALTKDIANFAEQTGLKVRVDIPSGFAGEELEPYEQIQLLSIIKEALNNVRKHAEAAYVNIAFALTEEQLCASIEDDGKGFDRILADHQTKYGLKIMQERASEIGAQVTIRSAIGQGCRIEFCLRLQKGEKTDAEIAVGR